MTRAQRIVAVLYCLTVAYCCLWVPWHVAVPVSAGGELQLGYRWLWNVDSGGPDMAAIALRIIATTALAAAVFLLARNWKVLTSTTVLAGLAFSGILLRDYLIQRKIDRQTQAAHEEADHRADAIHECALSKVAATCTPEGRFESCDRGGRYPELKSPEEAIKAAEGDCTAETDPHSAQRQIEDYRHQHRIDLEPSFEVVDAPPSRHKTKKK
jgi:hypothetical protein